MTSASTRTTSQATTSTPENFQLHTSTDLLIDYLKQLSVEYVFGIPGGAIEPLYNSLAKSEQRNGPKAIVSRHETSAAFMASGYHLLTGKLGVCCATTGPGATNLITGIACAAANNTPMLAITAQTALNTFGKSAFQESSCTGINTIGMFEHCTKYNTLVSHIDQFEQKLATAVMKAFQSPRGPVHLSIPLDVMRASCKVLRPTYDLTQQISSPSLYDHQSVDQLYAQLNTAKKIVFVIGEGASEAIGSILDTAAHYDALVITTPHGKGLVSPYHPAFRGVVGFAGHRSARDALRDEDLDLIITIGSNLGEWASNGWDVSLLLNNRMVHIDEQAHNFSQSPMAKLHVQGRISSIFDHILKVSGVTKASVITPIKSKDTNIHNFNKRNFELNNEKAWLDTETPIKPQRLMHDLPKLFPPNTRYLADTGASFAWAIHYMHPFDRRMQGSRNARGGLFHTCLEFAPMGWAIGSAIGMAFAKPSDPVVCITGDGSLLMNGQEITVAIQEQLTVIFVVLNDSALGMVKHGQKLTNAEEVGAMLPKVNFAKMAKSMGANAYRIDSPEELKRLDFKEICKSNGPTLLDILIDVDEVPPIGMRTDALKEAK